MAGKDLSRAGDELDFYEEAGAIKLDAALQFIRMFCVISIQLNGLALTPNSRSSIAEACPQLSLAFCVQLGDMEAFLRISRCLIVSTCFHEAYCCSALADAPKKRSGFGSVMRSMRVFGLLISGCEEFACKTFSG